MQRGLAAVAAAHPERTALIAGERRVPFAALHARATAVAGALAARGISAGDRIAVALRNRVEFYEVVFGAALLGVEIVPVSWRAKESEFTYLLEDARARLAFVEDDAIAGLTVATLTVGEEYERALTSAPPTTTLDPAPPLLRFYTSGTTGRPKAVERARPGAIEYLEGVARALETFIGTAAGDVHLCCGPLYHSAPLGFSAHALLLGQTVVLLERFDPSTFLRAVAAERVTWTMMVPIHFVRLLALPEDELAAADVSSIRRILHAAAPCPEHIKRRVIELFPEGSVWEFYGMTEGRATLISPEEWLRKPGSVGRPLPGVRVVVLDDDGNERAPGDVGTVYVSTEGPPFSYAGDPEKTASAWRGEFYSVGDMGYLDEDGYLFLTDRKQDLIISGGSNVYPAEVEATLHLHPAIADVAVIGVPDDEWGEAVAAVVELRAPADAGELIAFARERLAHYKCPRTIEIVPELPREPNGKIRKAVLRAPYWDGRDRVI